MSSIARSAASRFLLFAFLALSAFLTQTSLAQELPKEIRGYKVHREKIEVAAGSERGSGTDAVVTPGDPKLVEVSLTGISFELTPEIRAMSQSGTVDFLTFHDFRVNGIPVEVEEYTESFPFRKNQSLTLPKPARVTLPTHRILQAAWKEMKESKKEWEVTGRVFVFGRFRKFGFTFKRVVPVDVALTIKNPIA